MSNSKINNLTIKGEFQEVECGNYFTFGDLENCPDTSLKNWAREQSWYNPEVRYSFIDVGDCLDNPCRIAVIKQSVAYIYTYNIPNKTESYKSWEKWKIKNLAIYK